MMKTRGTGTERAASGLMAGIGSVALVCSIIYTSSILALIGLGLVFWGVVFLYVRDQEYVRKALLDTAVLPSLATLGQLIGELGYKGKAVYLPSKYFNSSKGPRIYISKKEDLNLPSQTQIRKCNQHILTKHPSGLCLTPPGVDLAFYLEKLLKTRFAKVDLQFLQRKMPRILEDLEISQNVEMQIGEKASMETGAEERWKMKGSSSSSPQEYDVVSMKVTDPICFGKCEEASRPQSICGNIGCPLYSAMACAIVEVTGKPTIIDKIQRSARGREIEVIYRFVEAKKSAASNEISE